MSFKLLNDEEERELHRLSMVYWKEALRCEKAKAFLAGTVVLGAALETLLILMVNCHPEEAELTGRIPMKKGVGRPLLEWNLADLLKIAKAANWLPSALTLGDNWDRRKAKVGDYAEVVRMLRNLVHPARYVEDHYRRKVTAKYLQRQFEVVLLCRDWLAQRNNEDLRGACVRKESCNCQQAADMSAFNFVAIRRRTVALSRDRTSQHVGD